MKKVLKNKIINIPKTDKFDSKFNFSVLNFDNNQENTPGKKSSWRVEIINMSELLEEKKNLEMLEKANTKPASYSNVYSPEDELEIFKDIFNKAVENNKKIHIVGVTLKEEIEILEKYYFELGFFKEEINCFEIDYSKVLVSVSVKIENLMWRGSDYKRMGKEIFFNPPIRESGQVKAMFKGINRGSIAGISLKEFTKNNSPIIPFHKGDENNINSFFTKQIIEENILAINLSRVLNFNLLDFGIIGEETEMIIEF